MNKPHLTPREAAVLELLLQGESLKTTAVRLGISWHSARTYQRRARKELGAATTAEAVGKWFRLRAQPRYQAALRRGGAGPAEASSPGRAAS